VSRLIKKIKTQQIVEKLSISAVTENSGWFCRNWIFQIVLEPTFPSALFVATSYFSGDIEKMKRDLELKEVPSGPNVQIMVPYDEGIYYKAQEVDSTMVANPIQIYLDLYNYRGRGREQAEFLRERMIKF